MPERLGLDVTIAGNGRVALDAYTRTVPAARFDLVPRNCHMPEVDGFACTRRLRAPAAEPGLSRTPIVALTASSEAEKVVACREAGRDDLLPKPVAFDALHAARALAAACLSRDLTSRWGESLSWHAICSGLPHIRGVVPALSRGRLCSNEVVRRALAHVESTAVFRR
jgi:CheY-like chemotaxis protein